MFFLPIGRSEIADALTSGRGDIAAAGITITEYGKELVDFSAPIYTGMDEVVVSAPGVPAVNSAEELSGKEVFVRKVSSYYDALVTLNQRLAAQKKPPVIIKEVSECLEDEDIIEMVNAGLIPLTIIKLPIAKFWKQVFPQITVNEQAAVRTGGELAWAMRKGSPQLKAAVDDFIKRNGKGTRIGNTILARYYGSAKYVKNATSEAERKKFVALVGYFQKYGDKYDVDWLLMAAQGYQESQLNQQAKSPVGAIGVMQVMPATGKDMRVGDITQTEPNINAGIKYMRWMIDNYYGNEPMTKLDKTLFAFASYNAGAGRIAGFARKQRSGDWTPTSGSTTSSMLPPRRSARRPSLTSQHLQVLRRLPVDHGGEGGERGGDEGAKDAVEFRRSTPTGRLSCRGAMQLGN